MKYLTLGVLASAFDAATGESQACRCTNLADPCWPSDADWTELNVTVGGRLVGGRAAGSPVQACAANSSASNSAECSAALEKSRVTEFWNMDHVGGFQSTGLFSGFSTRPSEFAIAASSSADVQAAVRFASSHNLRLVVKGAGHDYMGRNTATATGSIVVSTRGLTGISWHVPRVQGKDPVRVTVGAGMNWDDVYIEAQARGLFVQGGHCPSVGAVGGFSLGAGFGPFSRFYGTGADNMLSATVVVANGDIVVASKESHPDLFWALRGGGGGTFGIVTDITYKVYPAPTAGGTVSGSMSCYDEKSFEELLAEFLRFSPRLFNPHWGHTVTPDAINRNLNFDLLYIGISQAEARAAFASFVEATASHGACKWNPTLSFQDSPTVKLDDGSEILRIWPYQGDTYPHTGDPVADKHLVGGFLEQLNQWSFGQAHRYILQEEIETNPAGVAKKLVKLFKFPTTFRVLEFSKAGAGGGNQDGNVSANPLVRKAGLALMGNEHVSNYFPNLPQSQGTLYNLLQFGGVKGFFDSGLCSVAQDSAGCFSSDVRRMTDVETKLCWEVITDCFKFRSEQFHGHYVPELRQAFPTGSYFNEGDFFEKEWQRMYWGDNYPLLKRVKEQMDPHGLFVCRQCVGSEDWDSDGNCRFPRGKRDASEAVVV